jgi:hypothetical protein
MTENRETSPVLRARFAGCFYAIVVVASIYSHVIAGGTNLGRASGLVAGTANLIVTALLFDLLRPVGLRIALLAVLFNLEGIAHEHDPLAFFGCYCICTGYLIIRSTFLPRMLGVAMVLAGFGLLLNAYGPLLAPALPRFISSIAFAFDGVGEIGLTLWLILFGVNGSKWQEQVHGQP